MDAKQAREDAKLGRALFRRMADNETSNQGQQDANLVESLAGYAEECARLREGIEALLMTCQGQGAPIPRFVVQDELTAILEGGQ